MSPAPQNTNEGAAHNKPAPAAAQDKKPDILAALLRRGKWASYMLLLSLVFVFAIEFVPRVFYQVCGFDILPWQCAALDEGAMFLLKMAKIVMFVIAGCLSLYLVVLLAIFIYQWARALPKRGGLAILFLIVIVIFDLVARSNFQWYVGSTLDVVTNVGGILMIAWFAVSLLHNKIRALWERITEWWDGVKIKAAQAPVNAMKSAGQTLKNKAVTPLADTAKAAKDTLKRPFVAIGGYIDKAKKSASDKDASAKDATMEDASEATTKPKSAALSESDVGETAEEPVSVLSKAGGGAGKDMEDSIGGKVKSWLGRAYSFASKATKSMGDTAKDKVAQEFGDAATKAKDATMKGARELATKATDIAKPAGDKAAEISGRASSAAGVVGRGITSMLRWGREAMPKIRITKQPGKDGNPDKKP